MPTFLASLSLHSLPRNQLLPAESTPTCCVYSYMPGLIQPTQSTQEPASTCCVYSYLLCLLLPSWLLTKSTQSTQEPVSTGCVYSYLLCLILPAVSTPICLASLSLHNLFRIRLDILPPVHCPAHPLSYHHHHKLGIPHTTGHPVVRNDGKLEGLGEGQPSAAPSPLLHEVKLPGSGAGGSCHEGLRHEPKLSLPHEVKLCSHISQELNPDAFGTPGDLDPAPPVDSGLYHSVLLRLLLPEYCENCLCRAWSQFPSKPQHESWSVLFLPWQALHNSPQNQMKGGSPNQLLAGVFSPRIGEVRIWNQDERKLKGRIWYCSREITPSKKCPREIPCMSSNVQMCSGTSSDWQFVCDSPSKVTKILQIQFQFNIKKLCTSMTASGVKQHQMSQELTDEPTDRTTLTFPLVHQLTWSTRHTVEAALVILHTGAVLAPPPPLQVPSPPAVRSLLHYSKLQCKHYSFAIPTVQASLKQTLQCKHYFHSVPLPSSHPYSASITQANPTGKHYSFAIPTVQALLKQTLQCKHYSFAIPTVQALLK